MAQQHEDSLHARFGEELAASFQKSLAATCGGSWQLSTVDVANETGAPAETTVEYCLTFSGNLSGSCFIAFDRMEAEVLVAVEPGSAEALKAEEFEPRDFSEVLADVVHGASAGLQAALAAKVGSFSVDVAHAVAVEPSAVLRAKLLAVNDEGRSASIRLLLSPELNDSLEQSESRGTAGMKPEKLQNANLNLVMDVELNVTLRFGQRQLSLREILDLTSGSVVELDRQVDEPVELILDGRIIARGEAVIIDGNYGVRVTEVYEPVVN